MKKKMFISFLSLLAIALIIQLADISFTSSEADSDDSKVASFVYDLPHNLNFAGEKVPVQDLESREMVDKELQKISYSNLHSTILIDRANRWFLLIEQILKKNKVPDDFKYLALAESGFTLKVSPKGAQGFWQFVEPTALQCGLEISDCVDERYHVEKSTAAACRFFLEAFDQFQSWTLTAASYNRGINGLQKQTEIQKSTNYYDLLLNKETANYIFRILALKEVLTNTEKYGYPPKKRRNTRIPTFAVKVDSSILNLEAFAGKFHFDLKTLKIFNPWMKAEALQNPGKKTYLIQFPKDSCVNYSYLEAELGLGSGKNNDSIASSNLQDTAMDHPLKK